MNVHGVIFDMDGTLIDSAPSILASIKVAFDEVGVEPAHPLSCDLIGPPLAHTLKFLLTDAALGALPRIIESFKRHYDESGFRETKVYKGVPEMLNELRRMQLRLYVATNKRILPTRKIVQHLGWEAHFEALFALDSVVPVLSDKAAMLRSLRLELSSVAEGLTYVGDRAEDADAANNSLFPFLWASWGYGALEFDNASFIRVEEPAQLPKIFKTKILLRDFDLPR